MPYLYTIRHIIPQILFVKKFFEKTRRCSNFPFLHLGAIFITIFGILDEKYKHPDFLKGLRYRNIIPSPYEPVGDFGFYLIYLCYSSYWLIRFIIWVIKTLRKK